MLTGSLVALGSTIFGGIHLWLHRRESDKQLLLTCTGLTALGAGLSIFGFRRFKNGLNLKSAQKKLKDAKEILALIENLKLLS